MALSTIDYYAQAAQRAALVIAAAPIAPKEIVAIVGTLAFAVLGIWGIEFISNKRNAELIELRNKYNIELMELQRNHDAEMAKLDELLFEEEHIDLYRVAPRIEDPQIEEKMLDQFLEKIKAFKAYKHIGPIASKTGSEEEVRQWWKLRLSKGICHGTVSALLDIELKEGETFSLQSRVAFIDPEEAMFRQCVHELKIQCHPEIIHARIKLKQLERSIENINYQYELIKGSREAKPPQHHNDPLSVEYRESQLKKYDEEEMRLNVWDPLPVVTKLKKGQFSADLPRDSYQIYLENAIECLSIKNGQIRGTIDLPHHVMAFQYGPEEYFIYDSFSADNGGLFKYPDKETFFRGMRLLVQQFMHAKRDKEIKSEEALVSFGIYEGHPNHSKLL